MISNLELTPKQMRKIMEDHQLHGKSRTGKPYKNSETSADLWTPEMDLIKNDYSIAKNEHKWSMDIKYIQTEEGTLYINAIRDFYSQAIIGYHLLSTMTYEDLVKPSIEMAVKHYKKLGISYQQLIIHTDNGKQYYARSFIDYAKNSNILLSKKQPNKFGGNALSENWFYHLSVEWIGNKIYKSFEEATKDIIEYIHFYNYDRIHTKWNDSPMSIFGL